ncbi:winged helix DNA-binding domain-containing protein [Streptomyces sp. P6-2-1]|uniref:winged helix DNA-binding domain-containing protein n=1 Tax=Streptomyces sp. P6-2-1 TaxID=3422591 RepID=UPI003D35D915
MPGTTLSLRALNRALLARQLLLARERIPVPDALRRLFALQAQVAKAPYIGLWSRLEGFTKNQLAGALEERDAVRATFLRATLQVLAADDYLALRASLEPALVKAMRGFMGTRAEGLDMAALAAEARALLAERPRTLGEMGEALLPAHPDRDAAALSYITLRCHLPVVQRFPGGAWSAGGQATYVTPEEWLGGPPAAAPDPGELVRRHLAAFGPATVKDVQSWSGLTGLTAVFRRLRPELRVLRSPEGTELYDLPGAPLPEEDGPVPVRFLPEYDNVLLAHQDRTRVLDPQYRSEVYRPGGRVRPVVLVDGFVGGVWGVKKEKAGRTRLTVDLFAGPGSARERDAVADEAARLLAFMTDEEGHPVDVRVRD